ncbi:uncharacterized mitochondrial protein AtMg00810-like [Humulus lupulus]|uniref:uncharacterized mitochondrial protein AtMg00810-like n=1 Tax=Humulus lupulus TaxID=3486 RepID=UPI002B412845|nr:uncharacterized mitochondrial protein AtMg00810-like [Humulus lupulus]
MPLPHIKVYSRHPPPISCPIPASLSSDPVPSDDLPNALHEGKSQCAYPISSFFSYNHLSSSSCSFIASIDSILIPKTIRDAISHPSWHNAMIDEMNALDDNGTWDMVDLPSRKRAIGYSSLAFISTRYQECFSSWKSLEGGVYGATSLFYCSGGFRAIVYVDDIFITGNDTRGISSLKYFLHTQFHTKDFGMLKYFLGIEVTQSKQGIFLFQRKYVLELLTETGKLGEKPCSTPMSPNVHLKRDGEPFEVPEKYRRLVGKLNYLTVTRLDIAFSVSIVSQFMSSPTIHHWAVLEQILCYLKGAPGRGIMYADHGHTHIECFSDENWAGSKVDRRSTSGYCIVVGENFVSWKSKKQNVVSRCRAESEYRVMAQSVCEVMWIYQLLTEVGLKTSVLAKL